MVDNVVCQCLRALSPTSAFLVSSTQGPAAHDTRFNRIASCDIFEVTSGDNRQWFQWQKGTKREGAVEVKRGVGP